MKFQLYVVCFFLFALFNVVFTLTDEEEDKIAATCQKETGASDDDLKILDDENELPENKKQYCLLACFYKATGTMDANNKLVYEEAVKEFESMKKENKEDFDKFDNILKECIASTTPQKDQCDSLKQYFDCLIKRSKEIGVEF